MPKSNLENSIQQAAGEFALKIVEAVRSATLQELIKMQSESQPKKPGRKPSRKPGPKPTARKAKPGPKPKTRKAKPGPKPKAKAAKKIVKKKRVMKNYPKCAYPRCKNNRFPRGKGFCGKHWKMFQAGKIKSAAEYQKK
jgi:hypothetical protein